MSRTRLWLFIGLTVVLAAFFSGFVRGCTGTSPFDVTPSPSASVSD